MGFFKNKLIGGESMKKRKMAMSMAIIKKEKLAIILKELLHLKYILNYYSPKQKLSKENEIRKIDMSTAFSSLEAVEKSLKKLQKHIDMLQKSAEELNDESNIYFLILHSKISRDFSNILYVISLIYKKVYQIFEESYHQYIPKPTLGRRFSNNSLVNRLKEYYETIINQFIEDDYKGLILSWSYTNYISLEEKHDTFTSRNGSEYGNYINIPYWYYEIPTLLPSITHECIQIALLQESSILKEYKASFIKAVNQYLNTPQPEPSFIEEEKMLDEKHNLTNKIIADIISYNIYNNAYLFSLFHDIAGANLAKLFRLRNKDTKKYNNLKEYIEENFLWKISSYKFEPLIDLSYIRLTILIQYAIDRTTNSDECKAILEMKSLLSSIFMPNESKYGLEKIYREHHHYYSSYQTFQKAHHNISQLYLKIIDDTSLPKKLKDISANEKIKSLDFNKLWRLHLENNSQKNDLRKEMHQKTFAYINQFHPHIARDHKELGIPYSLTFVKILKVLNCSKKQKTPQCLDSAIQNAFKEDNYYHAFGIYDLAIIKKSKNSYYKSDDNAKKKSYIYGKSDDAIKRYINSLQKIKESNIRFYESKFSLMQIYPTINGNINSKSNSSNNASILYNIDLNYKMANGNRLKFLAKAITIIADTLREKCNEFSTVQIFKTLGPGDLILHFQGVSNDKFLQFAEILIPLPCIKRTFTTILAERNKKMQIEPSENYRTVSFIRLNLTDKVTLNDIIQNTPIELYQHYIESIHITSGVLDLEIIWKAKTKVKTVMGFYNHLMEKKYIRDFQTKFNKVYPLKKNTCNVVMWKESAK